MNVRKRGLALLMCICMIFTLLPFSAFADGTSEPDVVYGQYDKSGTTWKQVANAKDTVTETVDNQGNTVTLRKTATPTGNENEYTIDLEVITTETSSTKAGDAATVLVIDVSGSMKWCAECGREVIVPGAHNLLYGHDYESRIAAAKDAAKQFIDAFKSDNARRYVSVVSFSTDSSVACEWKDVSTAAGYKAVKEAIDGLKADGGTNFEQGLSKAKSQLDNTTVKDIASKNVIALTDGKPTYWGTNDNGGGDGEHCYEDVYNQTKAAATNLKNTGAKLYTVCFGASNEKITEYDDGEYRHGTITVGDFLKNKIATPAAGGKTYAYNADNTKALLKAFKDITDTITEGISAGTVKDGLPTGVSFVGNAPTAFVENADGTYSWELIPANAKQGTDGEKTTYTYTVSYVVTLGTSDPEFNEDIYHALNKETTFTAGDEVYYFNVPGVKGTAPRYNVTYEYAGTVPTGAPELPDEASYKAGATVKVAAAPTLAGYTFSGWTTSDAAVSSDGSFTMPSKEVKLTGSWTLRSDLSYTVHYYWNGTETKVAEDKTVDSQTFNETVTETPVPVNGYTPVSDAAVELTIGTDTNANVITFYYYKNVELKANGDTVTYDGKVHSVSGFTGAPTDADFSAIKVGAKGTEAGTYPANFAEGTVGTVDATKKYIVTKTTDGELIINPIGTVTVTIKGNTDSKVYNGTEQSVTGYTVKISDPKYTEADFKFTGDPKASRTDVGTTPMGLNTDQFENNNKNFKNVTFVVEDGSLTITKRPLTIEGQSSEPITYDGQTHSFMKWWPVTPTDNTGLVSGHEVSGINYLLTGKDAGSYTGKFSGDAKIMSGEENVTENYSIEYTLGKMKIVPAERIAVKIIGNHKEVWYNGQEQSVSGFTFDVADNTVTVELKDGHYAIAKGTNVKTYYMGLKSDDFTINHKNYKEVSVEIVDGYLTIKRHYTPNPPITDKITVEITGNSDSVVYDGTEHSVKDYTVKISDSRYTEKDFTFSGKALASGVNAGTYEMGLKADQFKNTNARFTNVEFIIKADGVLTITQRPLTITAGSAEGIAPVTCDKYTVEGLATGDKVDSVKITGIQSEPGESPNVASDAVIKNAKGEDVTANYKITYVNGVLKAIEVLNKEIHFNYVIGYTDGTIRPNNDISRAEVATIFFRLLTDEAREQYTTTAGNFTDVKAGMWCNRAIATLTNMGIIKGYTDGTFQPNKSITRAELATIIARFAKLDVNTKTFSDINGHWAQKNIELAAGNGWINGYEDGTFRPNNNITRAETFAMINRVLDRQTESVSDLLPTSEMNMWSDNLNENAWYYKDVQEATNYHKCDRVGDSVYEKWTEKVPDIDWASYQI